MRWRGQRQSKNIEDRRGMAAPRGAGAARGGLLRLLPVAYRFLGFKGTAIVVLVIGAYLLFTGNLGILTGSDGLTGQGEPAQSELVVESAEEQELVDFVSIVLADTEETWHELFRQAGGTYQEPTLVLFRGAVSSACGLGQAAMGPFYCPGDHKLYIDLSFYSDLKHRFKAPGDFAQAYVIAHEVGHHVQTLLGISQKVQDARRRASETEANQLSVRLELQADCFAGVWAHHAHRSRQLLEEGDVEEGLTAASAIGDDRLQKQGQGYVSPDSFTHGSSAQRVKWFRTGLERGEMSTCDTFSVATP
ncbi:MAG TPA: neutral zinc metallopeptidase [Gammaproteobacteria bacterium]|nr:neutral zinc metallopeptidase [Gammaproteobacteria bacterium]